MLDLKLCSNYSKPATKMLTLNGTNAYIELPEAWVSTNGNWTAEIVFEGVVAPSKYIKLIDGSDSSMRLIVGHLNDGTMHITGLATATLDGISVSNGVDDFPDDGKLHTIILTGISQVKAGVIGAYYGLADNHFNGIIKSVKFTDLTTPENSREYQINNGRTDYIVDKLNPDDSNKRALLSNVSLSDWNSYHYDKQRGDWIDKSDSQSNFLKLTIRTTAPDEVFTLPLAGNVDAIIYWGDEATLRTTSDNPTHTYEVAGDYELWISGSCDTVVFYGSGSESKVIKVNNLGDLGWTTLSNTFRDCTNLESFNARVTNTSSVTNMYAMMMGWSSMTTPPNLSNFDTSSVTNMSNIMNNWTSMLTPPDLSSFDTSKVANMSSVMSNWSSMITPPNLSGFDTSIVTNMAYMMNNWASMTTPPDLSGFDTSSVTNMYSMMNNWSSMTTPPDLSSFDTSKVTDMRAMMRNWLSMGEINIPIDTWDIGLVTDMTDMLLGTTLTTACYDRTLIAWEAQGTSNVPVHFGNSRYTAGGPAETARTALISRGWTITDGGAV